MAVEAQTTRSYLGGLIKREEPKRVLDYRVITQQEATSPPHSSQPEFLVVGKGRQRPEFYFVDMPEYLKMAEATNEDNVRTHDFSTCGYQSEDVDYSEKKINEAKLVAKSSIRLPFIRLRIGSYITRVSWRETQEGDYPPILPGQTEYFESYQLSLKLNRLTG